MKIPVRAKSCTNKGALASMGCSILHHTEGKDLEAQVFITRSKAGLSSASTQ
ncbi:hypothetical protein [Pseudomonas borbori]|uniref:hypothetical protein n=1 Tax=Pseudomonas borbori TaxID=289003 RepID=UPI0014812A9A|nr:hypothetical protein [Pseudomonas borbori]